MDAARIARVITMPWDISMGCGLSVRFPLEHARAVHRALRVSGIQ